MHPANATPVHSIPALAILTFLFIPFVTQLAIFPFERFSMFSAGSSAKTLTYTVASQQGFKIQDSFLHNLVVKKADCQTIKSYLSIKEFDVKKPIQIYQIQVKNQLVDTLATYDCP